MTDITNSNDSTPGITSVENVSTSSTRKRFFGLLAAGVAVAGAGYYAYDTLVADQWVSTDNAYVGANVAQVTSQVAGPVAEVTVDDAQIVKRGDVLVRLDNRDMQLALNRAEAQLASAERKVRGLKATDSGLTAQIAARGADLARADAQIAAAQSELTKAQVDLKRRNALAASGSVSGEEVTSARNAMNAAQAGLRAAVAQRAQALATRDSAQGDRDANAAMISGAGVENNPEVLAARAQRDQARIDLDRTVVRSPIDGVVSRRQVQVGQRVQPGVPMMTVVPIQQAYVDANFKEVQLSKVRPGQPVTLTADLYGSDIKYTGRVVGFSGGTGAAFAVVPAQNATGNWIKVVQRLPVRIRLDASELAAHPLRVGLSMNADINVSK